jgi:hypothetical protein
VGIFFRDVPQAFLIMRQGNTLSQTSVSFAFFLLTVTHKGRD